MKERQAYLIRKGINNSNLIWKGGIGDGGC